MIEVFNFVFRFFSKLKRLSNLAAAKKEGLKIGPRSILVGDQAFGSEPFLIQIGSDCLITNNVKFITHDGSIQVPLIKEGEHIHKVYSKKSVFDRIQIGDNVFIGVDSIILPGTIVGSNTIIGAGSVVKGIYPANSVVSGNPARVTKSLDEYYKKQSGKIVLMRSGSKRKELILGSLPMSSKMDS
ncbi:PaaY Carbonic anhydrases/acetyltransferases, isoleucine patch superfamily [Burkholderiaceae bacterium]